MTGIFAVIRKPALAALMLAALGALAAVTAPLPASADSFAFAYRSGPGWHRHPYYHHHRYWGPSFSYTYVAPAYAYPAYAYPAYPVYVPPPPVVYAPPVVYGAPPIAAAPASPVFQAGNGQYCREYQATVMVGGQPQPSYGTACLQPDGVWRVVN